MKKLIAAAALSALVAGPVAAQAYVGVGVGESKTENNNTSWKVYGGYQIDPIWGVELAYNNLDHRSGTDTDNLTLAGTGTLALNQNWSLIGKAGVAANRSSGSDFGNHSDLMLGAGVAYNLSKNVGLRLEYEDFGKLGANNNTGNFKAHNVALSLKYGF
jgi:OmpA-OmpF porin, OOP family